MKELDELHFPKDRMYYHEHEWVLTKGGHIRIGISDYAQDQLGDIVFVELPEPGTVLSKGDVFGTVESVKSVSELYMPMGGEIVATNQELEDAPELVNNEPYAGGWMVKIKPSEASELDGLMSKEAYVDMLKG